MKAQLLLTALLIGCAFSILADDEARITGWSGGSYWDNFQTYSGFFDLNNIGKTHYFFITKYGSNEPELDPIVVWVAGGKECSALRAALQEFGPFTMKFPQTDFTDSSSENLFSWNKQAHILLLEAPFTVGFSQFDDPDNVTYDFSDDNIAEDIFATLQAFLRENPQFKENRVTLAGEGLAGLKIPTIVKLIQTTNTDKALGDDQFINLTSVMLQNATLQDQDQFAFWESFSVLQFLWSRGYFGPDISEDWIQCSQEDKTPECEYFDEKLSENKTQLNPMNVNDMCETTFSPESSKFDSFNESSYCQDHSDLESWMLRNKAEFNAPDSMFWNVCQAQPDPEYTYNLSARKEVEDQINSGIKYTFVSGINDAMYPTQMMIYDYDAVRNRTFDLTYQDQPFYNGLYQLAGWTTASTQQGLQLIKVRGAGHMIGYDQPLVSNDIIAAVVRGELLVNDI